MGEQPLKEIRFFQIIEDDQFGKWPFTLWVKLGHFEEEFSDVIDWCWENFGEASPFQRRVIQRWTFHPRLYRIALRDEVDFVAFRLRWM